MTHAGGERAKAREGVEQTGEGLARGAFVGTRRRPRERRERNADGPWERRTESEACGKHPLVGVVMFCEGLSEQAVQVLSVQKR